MSRRAAADIHSSQTYIHPRWLWAASVIKDSLILRPVWLTGDLKMEGTYFTLCSLVALSEHNLRLCHLSG